jgi:hypothetical protein
MYVSPMRPDVPHAGGTGKPERNRACRTEHAARAAPTFQPCGIASHHAVATLSGHAVFATAPAYYPCRFKQKRGEAFHQPTPPQRMTF